MSISLGLSWCMSGFVSWYDSDCGLLVERPQMWCDVLLSIGPFFIFKIYCFFFFLKKVINFLLCCVLVAAHRLLFSCRTAWVIPRQYGIWIPDWGMIKSYTWQVRFLKHWTSELRHFVFSVGWGSEERERGHVWLKSVLSCYCWHFRSSAALSEAEVLHI